MAKAVILYESSDGQRWATVPEAERRDALCADVAVLAARLLAMPRSSGERARVDMEVVKAVKRGAVELCQREFPREACFIKHDADAIHLSAHAGRFLGDAGGPLDQLWYHLMCIRDCWLYEQPYFAANPDNWLSEKRGGPAMSDQQAAASTCPIGG